MSPKKKTVPSYHIIILKILKPFKWDRIYAKKIGWTYDYGFGVTEPHFHTPYGDLFIKSY